MQYQAMGYLPEAMVNFLARLGWSHGDAELFSRDELIAWFDLDNISPSPSRFDAGKLKWVNQEHLKRLPQDELGRRLIPYLSGAGLNPESGPNPGAVAVLLRDRVLTLTEMADAAHYFYATPHPSPEHVAQHLNGASRTALADLLADIDAISWTREAIGAAMKAAALRRGLKPPLVMMAMRVVVCGTPQTPSIDAVLALLGREVTRTRLVTGLA